MNICVKIDLSRMLVYTFLNIIYNFAQKMKRNTLSVLYLYSKTDDIKSLKLRRSSIHVKHGGFVIRSCDEI